MKKLKSKIVIVLMAAVVMIFSASSPVFAAENDAEYDVAIKCDYELPENSDSSSEYFRFENPLQRMDSNGNFIFSFSWAMYSDYFKPKNSSITVYVTATSTSNKNYAIYLHEVSSDKQIGGADFVADGNEQSCTFTGLDTDSYYYLSFTKPIFSDATITGSGRICYIK